MRRKTETISFRANEDLLRYIDQQRRPFGISRGDWVRGVIVAHQVASAEAQQEGVADTLQRLEEELSRLNTNQRRLAYILLTCVGHVDEQSAGQIVQDRLLP